MNDTTGVEPVVEGTAKAPRPRRESLAIASIAGVACAACCTGPVLGFFAALGLGTALGVTFFGGGGLLVAALGALWFMRRKRRRAGACTSPPSSVLRSGATVGDVPVASPVARSRS